MKITDEEMKKALNTLIDGCKERACDDCILKEKCELLDTLLFHNIEKVI